MKKRYITLPLVIVVIVASVIFWQYGIKITKTTVVKAEETTAVQQSTKQENSSIKAALTEFKNKAGFDDWMKRTNNGEYYPDGMKLIAVPEDDGYGWTMGAADAKGTAGEVTDVKTGAITAHYSFDDPTQVTTIGEIRSALPN